MDSSFIDINCDVGEGVGNENRLLPYISSCNIACGGHAGDQESMRTIALLAKRLGVNVGAHPSYPDREHFGRVSMPIVHDELIRSLRFQIQDFLSILDEERIPLHHIKAHGALYNDVAKDQELSKVFLTAIHEFKDTVMVYAPFNSVLEKEALKEGYTVKREAFADRNYNGDLSLVSRNLPHALLQDPEQVLAHVIHMVKKNKVKTLDGLEVPLLADTYCVHGDTPEAIQIVQYLSLELPKRNIKLQK